MIFSCALPQEKRWATAIGSLKSETFRLELRERKRSTLRCFRRLTKHQNYSLGCGNDDAQTKTHGALFQPGLHFAWRLCEGLLYEALWQLAKRVHPQRLMGRARDSATIAAVGVRGPRRRAF